MPTLALFGTSADPPTAAHQQIIHWLSYHYDQVAVWASDNPFKAHQTPLVHRMEMLRLLIADIDPPRHNIHLCPDLSHPRALITVEQARQHWSDADFTLVIGSDLVNQLPRWFRVEELFQQVHLLVVPRPGYDLHREEVDRLRQLGADVAIADLTGLPISSTAYREDRDAEALTPPIEAYIHRERLYQWQDGTTKELLTRHIS
jgi:nicotinate-nucleotide adenylyltransferase